MNPTLNQAIELLNKFNKLGYDAYLKGKGNGQVKIEVEYLEILPTETYDYLEIEDVTPSLERGRKRR